jgi:uncharacterized protein YjlB
VVALNATAFDPGTLIDALFETHGWTRSWRDTVYDFVHYHSQIHEVMGVARGSAKIECGGLKGRVLSLKAGDVLVLPAGTGHRVIDASRNFTRGSAPMRLSALLRFANRQKTPFTERAVH